MSSKDLIHDRNAFKGKIYKQCFRILDDLFPIDSLECKLCALDLINVSRNDEATTDEKIIIETLAKSLFQGREVTLPNGRKVQFKALYGDAEIARGEWIRQGRGIVKEFADAMMKQPLYRDIRNIVMDEMKVSEIVNMKDLDELKALHDDSESTVISPINTS